MKRDLFRDGFTAEDFDCMLRMFAEQAADKANLRLRAALAEAQTVYRCEDFDIKIWDVESRDYDTHTAKLVAIKPLELKP